MNDKLPEKEQAMFDQLLNFYIQPALKILAKDKSIIPMAVSMKEDGSMTFIGQEDDDEESFETKSYIKSIPPTLKDSAE